MAKMDFSGLENLMGKFSKAIVEMIEGKDREEVLKALKSDCDQLAKEGRVRVEKAKAKCELLDKLVRASNDLLGANNQTIKLANKLKSAIGNHKQKLEEWEKKTKITKLTARKIDELKETIVKEEESLAALEKTIDENELQLKQYRTEIAKMG